MAMHLSWCIALYFQHRKSKKLAQKIFCYHVSSAGKGLWQADVQQFAVVQIRAVTVLLSVISGKGVGSKFSIWNTLACSRTLCSINPRKKTKTQWGNHFFSTYIIFESELQNFECVRNVKSHWARVVLVFRLAHIRCLVSPPVCLWTLPAGTRGFSGDAGFSSRTAKKKKKFKILILCGFSHLQLEHLQY